MSSSWGGRRARGPGQSQLREAPDKPESPGLTQPHASGKDPAKANTERSCGGWLPWESTRSEGPA